MATLAVNFVPLGQLVALLAAIGLERPHGGNFGSELGSALAAGGAVGNKEGWSGPPMTASAAT